MGVDQKLCKVKLLFLPKEEEVVLKSASISGFSFLLKRKSPF